MTEIEVEVKYYLIPSFGYPREPTRKDVIKIDSCNIDEKNAYGSLNKVIKSALYEQKKTSRPEWVNIENLGSIMKKLIQTEVDSTKYERSQIEI